MRPDATASLACFVFSVYARRGCGVEGARFGGRSPLRIALPARRPDEYPPRSLASIRLVEHLGFIHEILVLQADHLKGAASAERVHLRLEETIDPSSLP